MKKVKQIMAIIGAILLVGLYALALIAAATSSPDSTGYIKAAIFATIVIPVLIWAYTFIYKLIKDNAKK